MIIKTKNIRILAISVLMFSTLILAVNLKPVNAIVDPEEIEQAITKGIAWLVDQQAPEGFWDSYGVGHLGVTAFVLIKLQDRAFELGYDPFDTDAYEYATNVIDGWQHLLNHIFQDDHGLSLAYGEDPPSVYDTGISLMSFAASGIPNRENPFGHDFNADGDPDSFGEIAQEIVNWLANAQIDTGANQGAWGYESYEGNEDGDNSVAGYAVLGLSAAEKFGCEIPESVRTKLDIWISNIQDPVDHVPPEGDDGGSGYKRTWDINWINLLKTGNLIFQMTFCGNNPTTQRFQDAMDYIERHWHETNLQPGWGFENSPAHYQAMYCLMKGLDYSGIDSINLNGEDTDWYQEFASVLLEQQIVEDGYGYWPNSPCYVWPDYPPITAGTWGTPAGEVLSTVWALLTLEKVTPPTVLPIYVDVKPGSWPNPINTKNKGLIPITICGSEDIDVMDIDPNTVTLGIAGIAERVNPLRWSYEDVATPYIGEDGGGHDLGGDDILDLVFYFDTQDVVNGLQLDKQRGKTLPLVIRGELFEEKGGTILWGQDYVRILGTYLQKKRLVVTIDRSHDTASIFEMWTLEQQLISIGAVVYTIEGSFKIPHGTDVLLIPAARDPYTQSELDMIYNWYYGEGSRLIWISGDSDFYLPDYPYYFTPDACNEVLETLGAKLRLSADSIEDIFHHDGTSDMHAYRVAVQTPRSDGELNKIFTEGVESVMMYGPTSVLGYENEEVVDLRIESLSGVEVIMQTSNDATPQNWDSSPSDYYFNNPTTGNYPMMAIEDKSKVNEQKFIIVSGESIFSDFRRMYDVVTYYEFWNQGYQEGKVLVDNVFDWFSSFPTVTADEFPEIPTGLIGQPIRRWGEQVISTSEPSFFRAAVGYIPEEIENEWFPLPPYDIRLFQDNEEILLERVAIYDKSGELFGYEEGRFWIFFQTFDPGDFEVGIYDMRTEFYVYNPYGGSDSYVERIFVNYIGPEEWYGPIGEPAIRTFTLIVNP